MARRFAPTRTTPTSSRSSMPPRTPGIDFYGGMRGGATETGKMMYGKAAFLLEVERQAAAASSGSSNSASIDPWNAAWTT